MKIFKLSANIVFLALLPVASYADSPERSSTPTAAEEPAEKLHAKSAPAKSAVDPDLLYDRLDGKGASGMNVYPIDFGGNLELHIRPPGQTISLAMKTDRKNNSNPVMVVGYRFKSNPQKQLVRRFPLTMPLKDGFTVYQDSSIKEYDKFIVTNNALSGKVTKITLEPGPAQDYPEDPSETQKRVAQTAPQPSAATREKPLSNPSPPTAKDSPAPVDEEGSLQNFSF